MNAPQRCAWTLALLTTAGCGSGAAPDAAVTDVPSAHDAADATDATSAADATDVADVAIAPDVVNVLAHTLAEGCDPLVPSHCGFPFPSDTWRVADATSPRGYRLQFGTLALPASRGGVRAAGDMLRHSDGFSPGAGILTHMPGATTTGLATSTTIARSLEADSPTVLIEAETGVRVPHFAEIDAHSTRDSARAFMIRPAARLRDATRYIVAIRNVVDAAGRALAPSDAFRALRDGTPFAAEPSVDARRAAYTAMFARLTASGVARESLQVAWDFTTASRASNTAGMLAMRDAALAATGPDGPPYVIDSVRRDVNADIALRIEGRVTVPLYLDQPGPGGRSTLDAAGLPVQNGTAQYPFLVIVPRSATTGTPAGLLQFGHGLFQDRYTIDGATFSHVANQHNYVIFAMDWLGMSRPDPPAIAEVIQTGDIARFVTVPDRGRQGFLNLLLAMRMMTGAFVRDPMVQFNGHSAIDPTRRYYLGGSQGGIYGATYMALTTDIERGVLAVPGQAYSLMLPRSVLYGQFELVLNSTVSDPMDAQYSLALAQMFWDRAEPVGYSPYITSDPLPGTPAHRVLVLGAVGDHQVPNVATHDLARTMGLRALQPAVRPVFGLEPVAGPYEGSAFVELEFGLPAVPVGNLPMRDGEDPHGHILDGDPAIAMVDEFFRTGVVRNHCDGLCDPN